MSRFFIWTFGCRSNQADSAAIREGLLRLSMTESESWPDADLIIVNTCTVTHRSDKQVRQTVRRLHRENPQARIVVTGCYAQRDAAAAAALPGVRLVLGNREKARLPEFLQAVDKASPGSIFCSSLDSAESRDSAGSVDKSLKLPMIHMGGKTRPLVKLQDGCDAGCAYCIVPHVRGFGRSAAMDDVLREIQSLADHGFQEIVLTGINLGAYGRRIHGHPRLLDLLRRIAAMPGLGRIRLSSIEPVYLDRAIITLCAEHPVFAPHFHMPLQSGSDRVLRRMRRPYTAEQFRDLALCIRRQLPQAGLGTDVLVGFPGETGQDFDDTCRFLEELPLSYLHAFPFSPREGTEAFALPDPVPSQEIKSRLGRILEIARSKNLAFRRQFLGQVLPAITLAKEEDSGASVVLTHNYIHARVSNLAIPPNRLVEVRIDEVRPDGTRATIAG